MSLIFLEKGPHIVGVNFSNGVNDFKKHQTKVLVLLSANAGHDISGHNWK